MGIHPVGHYLILTYCDRKQRKEHRFSKCLKPCWIQESEAELTNRVMLHFGKNENEFVIGSYAQFEHAELGLIWCQVIENLDGQIRIRFLQNIDVCNEFRELTVSQSKDLKHALPSNVSQMLQHRWLNLHNRYSEYSDRKLLRKKEQ